MNSTEELEITCTTCDADYGIVNNSKKYTRPGRLKLMKPNNKRDYLLKRC